MHLCCNCSTLLCHSSAGLGSILFQPVGQVGNEEKLGEGKADCTDNCDVHDADINHENKAPAIAEAVVSFPVGVKRDWCPAAPTLIELMWGLDDLVSSLWPVLIELHVEELKILIPRDTSSVGT